MTKEAGTMDANHSSNRVPLEMESSSAQIPFRVQNSDRNDSDRPTDEQHQERQPNGWWLNTRRHRAAAAAAAAATQAGASSTPYHGGRMEVDDSRIPSAEDIAVASGTNSKNHHTPIFKMAPQKVERNMKSEPHPSHSSIERMNSWMTQSSTGSLHDFDDSEWTPKDSSYGAAIPVAGWIPKNTRRLIEYSMIAVVTLFFVYLVVATSIRISDDNAANTDDVVTNDDNAYVQLDDIYYDVSKNDDDRHYNNKNNHNNRRYYSRTATRRRHILEFLWNQEEANDMYGEKDLDDLLIDYDEMATINDA